MSGKRKDGDLDYEYYENQAKIGGFDKEAFKLGFVPKADDLILPDE